MWRLKRRFTFEAAHQLPHHDGKCARLHGHSWQGWLICEGERLEAVGAKAGMVVDYGDMDAAIAELRENSLDHHYLNETTGLENPTSEELARWIYERVKPRLAALVAVRVDETCRAECLYRPEKQRV